MKLYFVRHGETDFNKKHILQGTQIDEELNETGVQQMKNLALTLPVDFEIIYTSPLKRVKSSADIINTNLGKPVSIFAELNERDFGSLAGKTWKDIPRGLEMKEKDKEQMYDYRPFGGESAEDVKRRLLKFLDIARNSGHKSALVVTSLGVLRMMYKLQGKDITEIGNATIHTFEST